MTDHERIPDGPDEMIRNFMQTCSMEEFLGNIQEALDNKDTHVLITIALTAPNSDEGFESDGPNIDIRMWHQREPSTPMIAVYTAQSLMEDAKGVLDELRKGAFYGAPTTEDEDDE